MATRSSKKNRISSGATCPVCSRNVGIRKPIMIGPPPHRELSRGDKVSVHNYPDGHELQGTRCDGSGKAVTKRWSVANGEQAT